MSFDKCFCDGARAAAGRVTSTTSSAAYLSGSHPTTDIIPTHESLQEMTPARDSPRKDSHPQFAAAT